jgi:chromatin segregation and condensation protein Rec8/ScpA/Scc1 (kleisin family)
MGFVPELPERPSLDRPLKVRVALASTLLACLELARDGELRLDQRTDWGTIDVSRSDTTMISDRMTIGSD